LIPGLAQGANLARKNCGKENKGNDKEKTPKKGSGKGIPKETSLPAKGLMRINPEKTLHKGSGLSPKAVQSKAQDIGKSRRENR